MAKDTDTLYHAKDGNTSPLNSADDVASALSDLSLRISDLETRPAPAAGSTGSGNGARMDRLESVLGVYFGSEFNTYDAAHRGEASSAGAATGADPVADGTNAGTVSGGAPRA